MFLASEKKLSTLHLRVQRNNTHPLTIQGYLNKLSNTHV